MSTMSSVYNMIHANNGLFKSDKQALYWLNRQLQGDVVLDSGSVFSNAWAIVAEFDNDGVSNITKILKNSSVALYSRSHHDEYMAARQHKKDMLEKAHDENQVKQAAYRRFSRWHCVKNEVEARILARVKRGDMGTDTQLLCKRLNKISEFIKTVDMGN